MEKLIIVLVIVFLLILITYIITTRNTIVKSIKKMERDKSLIDIYLKKRYDLIPNLVEVCKGYSEYEKETLERVTQLRSSSNDIQNENTQSELNNILNKYIALVENNPQLKASENYLNLQKELTNVENEIQASRRIYISSVTDYNNLIMRFPTSLIASIFNYQTTSLPKFDYNEVKITFNNETNN